MNQDVVDKIVKKIKSHINEDSNDYCRVGWAIKDELGTDLTSLWQKKRVRAKLIRSGEYYHEEIKDNGKVVDYDIYPVPKLELRFKKWQLKTFWWFFALAVLGGIIGIIQLTKTLTDKDNTEILENKIEVLEKEVQMLKQNRKNSK